MMINAVIASGLTNESVDLINSYGVDVIRFSKNPHVGKNVEHHSDLSFMCGYNEIFVCKEAAEYVPLLKNYNENIIMIDDDILPDYPDEAKLNCFVLGNNLICNVDTVSQTVLKYYMDRNYRILNVKQGYTKCSAVPVSVKALITDDVSIAEVCKPNDIDVLLISKGDVLLEGYNYGFIGGCCGKISDNLIAFNGDIMLHSDATDIIKFLNKYSVRHICLTSQHLQDVGSILPVYGGIFNEKE